MEITQLRHAWPEREGFLIDRKFGHPNYTFLHFFNSVDLKIQGETVRTRPHACILYRPETPQWFYSSQPLVHDWIHFDGNPDPVFLQYGFQYDTLYDPSHAGFITDLVRQMEFEFYSSRRCSKKMMDLLTEELFIRLSRACFDREPAAVDRDTGERFRLLRGEVFSNLSQPWSVEQMADRVGISKSRFYTLYKNIYGSTPVDDLIRARIDSAKNELLISSRTIGEIAEELGYNNLTHFMRQFKLLTGTTPDQYRKSGTKKVP